MTTRVWCQTSNVDKKQHVTVAVDIEAGDDSGVCTVEDLRVQIILNPPRILSAAWGKRHGVHVHVYESTSSNDPLPRNKPLVGLGESEDTPLRLEPSGGEEQARWESIYVEGHIEDLRPRPRLLRRLIRLVSKHQFTFVEANAHTGQSSLSKLLTVAYGGGYLFKSANVAADDSTRPAELLRQYTEIDLMNRYVHEFAQPWERSIVVVRNADSAYSDKAFWKQLLVDAPREDWLPTSFRFIFLAKPVIGRDAAVPCELLHGSVGRLKPGDFLLSDEETKHELLHAADEAFQGRDLLLEITTRECAGKWDLVEHAGATLSSYVFRANGGWSGNDGNPKEIDERELVLEMLQPRTATTYMNQVKLAPVRALLLRCLGSAPEAVPLTDEDDHEAYTKLIEHAILEPCGPDGKHVRLMDPLREKTVLSRLFPVRAFLRPTSLEEVLREAITRISASDDTNATVSNYAATIRSLFLEGLTHATDDECSVCPELARVFPPSHEAACPVCNDVQYTDIYVGGRVAWGIQLRVRRTGCPGVCQHPAPFAMRGRYGILNVADYGAVVVDVADQVAGGGSISSVYAIRVKSATISEAGETQPLERLDALVDAPTETESPESEAALLEGLVASTKPPIPEHEWLSEPRTELVQHMRRLLFDDNEPHRLIYLTGPRGIGKSELVWLFRRQLEYDEVDMAWHDVDHKVVPEGIEPLSAAAFALRRDARIDLGGNVVDLQPASPSTMHVVFLDDAHVLLEDEAFWAALERVVQPTIGKPWLPRNIRFIVAATTLKPTSLLPPLLKSVPTMQPEAFMLTDTQARDFLLRTPDEEGDDHSGGGRRRRLGLSGGYSGGRDDSCVQRQHRLAWKSREANMGCRPPHPHTIRERRRARLLLERRLDERGRCAPNRSCGLSKSNELSIQLAAGLHQHHRPDRRC